MIYFRVLCCWVVTLVSLSLHTGDCARIVGGKEVEPHSVPYIALLEDFENDFVCGGTLIHESWVLTAAHCRCQDNRCMLFGDLKTAYLGVHSTKKHRKDWIPREIKKNVPHPKYNHHTVQNDIMLLQLKNPVKVSSSVRIKALPNPVDDMRAGTRCFGAGWGATVEGGPSSDVLLGVNLTVVDRRVCKNRYNSFIRITDEMFCAGSTNNHPADTCQGDSGGPLVCGGVLRGVVSFGKGCGNLAYPGVYTFISKYDKWIRETIRNSE
ncbi:hypothetical protein UPYG_G00191110 [Umbra pygmaea]|uniref:Peptidase S1 domain-containing protein n=1 Tax=Umbra pygmaea TaxID=75934 RepID=A0ABD0WXH7_UMBPY